MSRTAVVLAILVLAPNAAQAQIATRVFGDAGLTIFTATQSFRAVLGRPTGAVFGGGLEIDSRRWFLTFGARRFHRSGHRVFVFNDQVFPLNVKDTITVTPVDLTVGRRFRWRGFIPYVGGGIGWHRYQETSDDATDEENVSNWNTGYHVLAGAERAMHRWLGAAIEAQWAGVPSAFGESATSVGQVYGEHNLGGFTLTGRIIVGR